MNAILIQLSKCSLKSEAKNSAKAAFYTENLSKQKLQSLISTSNQYRPNFGTVDGTNKNGKASSSPRL